MYSLLIEIAQLILLLCSHSVHNRMLPLLELQTSDKPQFLLISVYSVPHINIYHSSNVQNHKFS